MNRVSRALVAHPWLVYAVLTALSFPVLEMVLHGEAALQYGHDVFDDDVPRLFSIAADWRTFGPVLWDPHLTSGNVLLAQFALPPTAPDVLLSFVAPPFVAYAVNVALMSFCAGMGMHVFLRHSLRLAPAACFVGGIVATFAFWHYIYGYAALLLPLVLFTTDRATQRSARRRDTAVAVLLVAFLLLSSQVQIVLLDGVVASAWVVASSRGQVATSRSLLRLAAIWAAALLLAAPVLATQLVALLQSQREMWDLVYLHPFGPELQSRLSRYTDLLFGLRVTTTIGGTADIYGSYFLGALGLPLAIVGLVVPRRDRREALLASLILVIPVLDLLLLFAMPLQAEIPIVRSFQFVRVRHLVPVVLAITAAVGADRLSRPNAIAVLGARRRVIAMISLAVVALALAWQGWVALQHVRHPTGPVLARDGWPLALFALAVGGATALLVGGVAWLRSRRTPLAPAVLSAGMAAVLLTGLTAERFVYVRAERYLGGSRASWSARLAQTPAQTFVAAQPGWGRVLSIGEHANRALVASLDAVDGYQTIYPLRYHELFGALIAPGLAADPTAAGYYAHWGNRAYAFNPLINHAVANLLGVRWVYVAGDPFTQPGFVERFSSDGVTVYENPDVFPRSFLVHRLEVLPDRAAVIVAIDAATSDELRHRAYLAQADLPAPAPQLPGGSGDKGDRAVVEADAIDTVVIRATTADPAVLVLADAYTPDWSAEVDGRSEPVLPVNGALRGVAIGPGEHVVTFRYRPAATYAGIVIAITTALLLALWVRRDGGPRPGMISLRRLAPSRRAAGGSPREPG